MGFHMYHAKQLSLQEMVHLLHHSLNSLILTYHSVEIGRVRVYVII